MNKKLIASVALVGAAALALTGCSGSRGGGSNSSGGDNSGALVGVAMPTKTSERWIDDGNNVKSKLEGMGYKVDLQYSNDDVPQQQQAIDSMINKGAKVLIVASIDGSALSTQLANAAAQGIKVIAYDRLLTDTKDVDYYVTFDNFKVGVQQGTSLLTGLGFLDASGKDTGQTTPKNIELFAGSATDSNSKFFFDGAMSVLKPYIDSGKLVIPSGQTGFEQTATQLWKLEVAQARMETLINGFYSGGTKLDGVLAPYDGLSRGILNATQGAGIKAIVTGQDAEKPSDKLILDGVQYSTIFKDTRKLAETASDMADKVLKGGKPEVNDEKTYNNGVKVVPSYLHESVIITKDNLMKEIVDSGYYTKEEVEKGQ